MADLKKGTTVGGIPIVTIDMINKILDDSGAENIGNKMDKIHSTTLKTPTEIEQLALDANKNGFHQYVGSAIAVTGGSAASYTEGGIFNLTTDTAKGLIQLFSPTGNSELYYKNQASSAWERLINKSNLDSRLNSYLAKSGGTMSGALTVNSSITASTNISSTNGVLKSTYNGNTVTIGSANANYCHFSNSANVPFHFNKDVKVQGEIYAGSTYNSKVWHTGNFNPASYMPKSVRLTEGTDLNNIVDEGIYQVRNPLNKPTNLTGASGWVYVEVLKHTADWILQKIYNFEGTVSFMRSKSDKGGSIGGSWNNWVPLGGGMTFTKTVANISEWTAANNMYEMTITHSLGSENILSVVLTDPQKYSMNIGFQVIDANKIKVFCGENPTGKIVINATV